MEQIELEIERLEILLEKKLEEREDQLIDILLIKKNIRIYNRMLKEEGEKNGKNVPTET